MSVKRVVIIGATSGIGLEVGQQQGGCHAAQKQGRIHFLADEGQCDCDNRGEQGPAGSYKARAIIGDLGNDQSDYDHRQRNKIRYLGAFLFH